MTKQPHNPTVALQGGGQEGAARPEDASRSGAPTGGASLTAGRTRPMPSPTSPRDSCGPAGGLRPDLIAGGPHDYWSTEKPPSRGQHKTIADLACELFDIPLDSRYAATLAIARLRAAAELKVAGEGPVFEVPQPW